MLAFQALSTAPQNQSLQSFIKRKKKTGHAFDAALGDCDVRKKKYYVPGDKKQKSIRKQTKKINIKNYINVKVKST